MSLGDFWELIHRSAIVARGSYERTKWSTEQLARLPVPAIVGFELHLAAQRKRADTWLMWGAAWIILQGWCSDDGFFYFQPWLVGLGSEAFDRVAADPDSLAGIPQVRRLAGRARPDWSGDEWPDWELLNYVARNACERVTGDGHGLDDALEARGLHRVCNPAPRDDRWDFDDPGQRHLRLPRLAALLG